MDKNADKGQLNLPKQPLGKIIKKLKYSKTISLLQNSGNFDGKEELLNLVKSMQEDAFKEE